MGALGLDISDGNYSSKYPKKSDFVKDGIPFIRADNIRDGRVVWSDMKYISPAKHHELQKGHLKKNDILITTRGEIGKIARIGDEFIDSNINAQIVRINTKNVLDSRYFFYYLWDKSRKGFFQSIQTGTALQQLPVGQLRSVDLELPENITDQKRIADILSAFDDKIELNNKISRTLEQMAQAIFKEWYIKKPKFKNQNTKLWKVRNVMEIVKRIPVGKKYDNKTAFPVGKVPILDQGQSGYIGYHNDEPGVMASIDEPVVVFANHTCNYRLMTRPFSTIQNVLPYIGINGYPTIFVYYLTRGKITMQEYKGHWPEFEQQEFLVPTPELAVEFASNVKPMVQKMVEIEYENQKLAALCDLLLPKLMRGEVRV